jgi:hypothetical protein
MGPSSDSPMLMMASLSLDDVLINRIDHVYVGAPFEQREGGSPFMVCRILKLHPANASGIPTATVAYYLRRRDVTNRNLADHRVIFATFMTGIVPVSHIRQKCSVMFRDYLEDPEAFKKQDDSFVFFQVDRTFLSFAIFECSYCAE